MPDTDPDRLLSDLAGWSTVLRDGRSPHPAELEDSCEAMLAAAGEIRRLRAERDALLAACEAVTRDMKGASETLAALLAEQA